MINMGHHWVYILSVEDVRRYVGETTHLYTRFNTHWSGSTNASKSTRTLNVDRVLAIYRVDKEDMWHPPSMEPASSKAVALSLENEITLSMMKCRGTLWWGVTGGKYTDDRHVHNHSANHRPCRPLCRCDLPAEVNTCTDGDVSFKCPKRVHEFVWKKMREAGKFVDEDDEPCDFFALIRKTDDGAWPTFDYSVAASKVVGRIPPHIQIRMAEDATRFKKFCFVAEPHDPHVVQKHERWLAMLRNAIDSGRYTTLSVYCDGECNARNCINAPNNREQCICNLAFDVEFGGELRFVAPFESPTGEVDAALVSSSTHLHATFSFKHGARDLNAHLARDRHFLLNAEDADMIEFIDEEIILSDVRSDRKGAVCAELDRMGDKALPTIEFARTNGMKSCLLCGSRDYRPLKVEGRSRRVCVACTRDEDRFVRFLQSSSSRG